MARRTAKLFYLQSEWDEPAWLDVVGVEYQRLLESYPLAAEVAAAGGRLLDVGCGTGIFPSALDPELAAGVQLYCDLLDISPSSLRRAAQVMEHLKHFSPARSFQTAIEQIPQTIPVGAHEYDLIWAIHSFTTVEVERMTDVYRHLLRLLAPAGRLYVFQLTAESSYQALHRLYLDRHPDQRPFMTYEDSQAILLSLQVDFAVHSVRFEHRIPVEDRKLLQNYLRKCVLDDSLAALDFFAPLLPGFEHGDQYRFPQTVNLITVPAAVAR